MRKFNRKKDQIRNLSIETDINKNSDGSCIIKLGDRVFRSETAAIVAQSTLRNY